MEDDLNDFALCLKNLSNAASNDQADLFDGTVHGTDSDREQFKEFDLELVRGDSHPLQHVLENSCNTYILASQHVEPCEPGESSLNQSEDVFQNSREEAEELESVEGSPLKLQEFRKESVFICTITGPSGSLLKPLSVSSARLLVSLYNLACGELGTDSLPLWILCDGKDKQGVVAIGTAAEHKGSSLVIDAHIITLTGPVTETSKLPRFRDIVKRHNFAHGGKNVSMRCHAEYDLFGTPSREPCPLGGHGSLGVKLDWDKAGELAQTPPLDARAFIYATVEAGDQRSAAHYMYTELTILFGIARGLEEGVVGWTPSKDPEQLPMVSRVQGLIEELKLGSTAQKPVSEEEDEDLSPLKNLLLTNRRDLDVTEQLWKLLRECKSYDELTECLQMVFQSLQSGELQPMVHKSNKSQFAKHVRDSYFQRLMMPSLDGSVPLELLVEIGIEKLQRDYTYAFIGKDLVTASQLQHYLPQDLNLLERLNRLEKLHHALELVVMLEQFLSLPRITLASSAMMALTHYEKHSPEEVHTFNVPVDTTCIARLVAKCVPVTWRAELVSRDCGQDVSTVCLITSKPPFSHVALEQSVSQDNVDNEKKSAESRYYLTQITQDILTL